MRSAELTLLPEMRARWGKLHHLAAAELGDENRIRQGEATPIAPLGAVLDDVIDSYLAQQRALGVRMFD